MRVKQSEGKRGSLKWIQRAVNIYPAVLQELICSASNDIGTIQWVSPLIGDDYAEYMDGGFLEKIGCGELKPALKKYWPAGGPHWDALAVTDKRCVLLVEAKAHIPEMISEGSKASEASLAHIQRSLDLTAKALNANPKIPWTGPLYQYANRLAFLYFLRSKGINAQLVMCCFVGDGDMDGGATEDQWKGAQKVFDAFLGLPKRHILSDHITHIFPHVRSFE